MTVDRAEPFEEPLDEHVEAVEQAFETHWRHFGLWPGAALHDEDGVLWYTSPIRSLPYNAVIRTRIPPARLAEDVVARVAGQFAAAGLPFLWVVRPSDRPEGLARLLPQHGLDLVETVTGMDLELPSSRPPTRGRARVQVADDEQGLTEYEELLRTYWSVPAEDRARLRTMDRWWTGPRSPGVRFVAHLDGRPVGKLFLNLVELPARAGVYGVSVLPEARGTGVASALMDVALARAEAEGAARCVLHSSEMARPLYERLGFRAWCTLSVYATGPLFGTHHH